jgi:DNA-binding MarR family transcriptional regulator/GNAT superfamily N-acetyltransferase
MDEIDQIRAFNRLWTQQMGILSRSYLGSGLGLAEARVLHDLDAPGPHRARALAAALGLDEGQLSRIIAGFARKGWLERAPDPADARARTLLLSPAGQAVVAGLKAASRGALQGMMAQLSGPNRAGLVAGLEKAATALQTQEAPRIRLLAPGDAGWILQRHAEIYAVDEGFDASFEPLVAEILLAFLRQYDPQREAGWVAWQGRQRLGSIFCMTSGPATPDTAKLRLFLLEHAARGTGLAQDMMDQCLGFAQAAGYRKMRLWTHESHRAAGKLYARNGFRPIDSQPVHQFGQDLVDQTWERDF